MLDKLRASLRDVQIIKKEDYSYFIHPLSDGIPHIDPELLAEATAEITSRLPPCSMILAPEAMGIPLAVPVSMAAGIPCSIIRKRPYGVSGEICVKQHTGYSEGMMYINGLKAGDKAVIIDDIISTGGTAEAIVQALRNSGIEVCGIIVLFNKNGGAEKISGRLNIKVEALLNVEIAGGVLRECMP